jgi:hypothetical protein
VVGTQCSEARTGNLAAGISSKVCCRSDRGLLTPKFGKESDLWVQHGEESVRKKEGFFRRIRQKSPRSAICFRSARELLR